ncbi:MAG: hypothetical protein KJ906_03280 [Nanoarchaeota archaeon]|nr:hypothetical protein [Nanoarchaeota archaeon]
MAKPIIKEWYDITSPKYFGRKVIGQSLTTDPNRLLNRVIEVSLVELTGEATKYYIKLYFKADKIEGTKVSTVFFGHDTTRDFVARIVQLGTDRIDTNNIVQLKDGKMRIKSIIITNGNVKRGLERVIRKTAIDEIKIELEDMTIDDFLKNMVTGSLQKKLRKKLSKLHPLRQFEFNKSQILI